MERDDVIEYSLDTHHSEEQGGIGGTLGTRVRHRARDARGRGMRRGARASSVVVRIVVY